MIILIFLRFEKSQTGWDGNLPLVPRPQKTRKPVAPARSMVYNQACKNSNNMIRWATTLRTDDKIVDLHLPHGHISKLDGISDFVEGMLAVETDLREIDLAESDIDSTQFTSFLKQVQTRAHYHQMKIFDVSYNKFGQTAQFAIADLLKKFFSLEVVKLDGIRFNAFTFKPIMAAIKCHKNWLETLSLREIGLGVGHDDGWQHVADLISALPRINKLDIGGNTMNNEGAIALQEALKEIGVQKKKYFKAAVHKRMDLAVVKGKGKIAGQKSTYYALTHDKNVMGTVALEKP